MDILFWSCLAGGVLFALVTVLFGEVLGHFLGGADGAGGDAHPWLSPMSLIGGITAFGGAGILLQAYSPLTSVPLVLAAAAAGLVIGGASYFLYIRPMRNAENSTGFSIRDLEGMTGEVLTAIPAVGAGEVLIRVGAGRTNQIAASLDGTPIPDGTRIVVVRVEDHTLYVTPLDL